MAYIVNDTGQAKAIQAIVEELARSTKLHGPFTKDDERRMLITIEEGLEALLECTKAALEIGRWDTVSLGGVTKDEQNQRIYDVLWKRRQRIRIELTHLGAMALKSLVAINADIEEQEAKGIK